MDTAQACTICDEMQALITDVAVTENLSQFHLKQGNREAAEGCRQTARAALDQIEVRLQTLRTYFQ